MGAWLKCSGARVDGPGVFSKHHSSWRAPGSILNTCVRTLTISCDSSSRKICMYLHQCAHAHKQTCIHIIKIKQNLLNEYPIIHKQYIQLIHVNKIKKCIYDTGLNFSWVLPSERLQISCSFFLSAKSDYYLFFLAEFDYRKARTHIYKSFQFEGYSPCTAFIYWNNGKCHLNSLNLDSSEVCDALLAHLD